MPRINIVQHPVIADNKIISGKAGETPKDTLLIGSERVTVGVKTGNKIIKKNPATGLNEEVDEVVDKIIYDSESQLHAGIFALDLETGGRGWYPGKPVGD